MKSKQVMKKPRLDEYIHELCNRPVDKKLLKKMFREKVHARVAAMKLSKRKRIQLIDGISNRLY